MKKLYVNIEDIYIKGNPLLLTEVVTSMDVVLQKMSQSTENVTAKVIKYSSTNKGKQYEKMVRTLLSLRNILYESSIQLNDMQNQIVAYQNKVLRYEGMTESASLPNKHSVSKYNINVDITETKFRIQEMMELSTCLNDYSESIFYSTQNLIRNKNDASRFWQDTQYNDFAQFIDEIAQAVISSLKIFGEYVSYLDEKIKELS